MDKIEPNYVRTGYNVVEDGRVIASTMRYEDRVYVLTQCYSFNREQAKLLIKAIKWVNHD